MYLECRYAFDCDDKIAESIMKLNRKGYETDFCCEGHLDIDKDPYISFTRIPSIVLYNNMETPTNWYYDNKPNNLVIKRRFTDEEREIFYDDELIDLAMKELKNWVDKLPDMNDVCNYKIGYEIKEMKNYKEVL